MLKRLQDYNRNGLKWIHTRRGRRKVLRRHIPFKANYGYNSMKKKGSKMKKILNRYLSANVHKNSNALVIDAETLCTSRELKKTGGMNPSNVTVMNYDENVIRKAKKNGFHGFSGISTNILKSQMNQEFDIIYLDYCGTPECSKNGFNPKFDIETCLHILKRKGVMAVTFSKRCKNAVEKARELFPRRSKIVVQHDYFETAAMVVFIVGHRTIDAKKHLKMFNNLLN